MPALKKKTRTVEYTKLYNVRPIFKKYNLSAIIALLGLILVYISKQQTDQGISLLFFGVGAGFMVLGAIALALFIAEPETRTTTN